MEQTAIKFDITDEQRDYLKTLICQRISDHRANKEAIEKFSNEAASEGILDALKSGGYRDSKDKLAVYIIWDPADNEPLLFFSLRCGEMHTQFFPESVDNPVESTMMLMKAAYRETGTIAEPPLSFSQFGKPREYKEKVRKDIHKAEIPEWAAKAVSKQLDNGTRPTELWKELWNRLGGCLFRQKNYHDEMGMGENIIRTKKTFAAVELAHFCVHEPARKKWEAMKMGQTIGRTMFWQFVEPKIREIRKLVGCEYIYLFAAENGNTGRLTDYYEELGFAIQRDIRVTKPKYDFTCEFMCQEVTSLRNRRNDFFGNYNKPRPEKKK